ncbi:hypothetical protein L1047_05270 [Synechococcus sp. Nb3U1]|uniref:hypothetical protein n=1 Tax=Synechococcus sp. Nb3U1 TaxID=1914529 RepID=UPI001F24D7D7|nr:hypothetical protein [Synechococcus sp. Nb3U1]MCF2970604.1 hypothetical protein [Synechococcus sp. Nb3U1]
MLLTHYYIRLEEALRHSWPRGGTEAEPSQLPQAAEDPEQEILAVAHRIELEQAKLAQERSLHQLEYWMRRPGFL